MIFKRKKNIYIFLLNGFRFLEPNWIVKKFQQDYFPENICNKSRETSI